jgi:asparagine synthetase B (glutamine-hydrolysing)
VSGFVAVVSWRPDAGRDRDSVTRLAGVFEAQRGRTTRRMFTAGRHGTAIRFADVAIDEPSSVETAVDGSWAFVVGPARVHGPLVSTTIEQLDGQFASVAYDATRDELAIGTDPLGMFPLYTAARGHHTWFSTSALALATFLGAQPSRLGIWTFLRTGSQFGTRTNWEEVERVDPARLGRFGATGVSWKTYWRPERDEPVTRLGLDEAAEHCASVAVEKWRATEANRGPRWADLTGGYDTRVLNVLLRVAQADVRNNTVGDTGDDDVEIASRVAAVAGWDWTQLALPEHWPETVHAFLAPAVAWGDGQLDALHLAEVLYGHQLKRERCCRLVGGGGGEHLQYYAWRSEFRQAGKSAHVNLERYVRTRLMKPVPAALLRRFPADEVYDDLAQRMRERIGPYAGEVNTSQFDVMHAYKSMGHHGAYIGAATSTISSGAPFLDKDVFRAAFSVHSDHRDHHRLMKRMIERTNPRVAAIETTSGGPAESLRFGNVHQFLPYYGKLARKAVTKFTDVALGHALLVPRANARPRDIATRVSVLDRAVDGEPLRPAAMRCRSLFDDDALDDLVSNARTADFRAVDFFGRVLTVELALRAADATLDGP